MALSGMAFRGFGKPQGVQDLLNGLGLGGNPQTVTPPLAGMPPMGMPEMADPADPQDGFFQKNGLGLNLLGAVADGVSTAYGAPPVFAQARQQHMQRQQRVQDMRQERQFNWQDWVAKQQYERANPAPVKNDTVNDYDFLRQKLGDEAANQYLRNFAAGPVMAVEGFDAAGNPTKTFVPRGSVGSPQPSAAPSGPAVGTVRNGYRFKGGNPSDQGAWEKVGGAPSQGGGTFR